MVCAPNAATSTTDPQFMAYSVNAVPTDLQISAVSKIIGSLTLAITVKIYVCTLYGTVSVLSVMVIKACDTLFVSSTSVRVTYYYPPTLLNEISLFNDLVDRKIEAQRSHAFTKPVHYSCIHNISSLIMSYRIFV